MVIKKTTYENKLAGSAFGLFAILAVLVKSKFAVIQSFDLAATDFIARLDSPTHTMFFKVVGNLASPAVTLGLAVLFGIGLYLCQQRTLGLLVISTMVGGDALALLMKELVRRLRPTDQVIPDTGFSFPSGHVFGTALLVILLLAIGVPLLRSVRLQVFVTIVGIAWILLVIVARLYARAHFASDTVGSVLLAGGCWQQAKAWYWHWQAWVLARLNRRATR